MPWKGWAEALLSLQVKIERRAGSTSAAQASLSPLPTPPKPREKQIATLHNTLSDTTTRRIPNHNKANPRIAHAHENQNHTRRRHFPWPGIRLLITPPARAPVTTAPAANRMNLSKSHPATKALMFQKMIASSAANSSVLSQRWLLLRPHRHYNITGHRRDLEAPTIRKLAWR